MSRLPIILVPPAVSLGALMSQHNLGVKPNTGVKALGPLYGSSLHEATGTCLKCETYDEWSREPVDTPATAAGRKGPSWP